MKCSTASWTLTVAAAALLALPSAVAAQTPPATHPPATAQPATQPPAGAAQATPAATQGSAQDHLRQAKAALDDVGTANLSARARTQVAELKKRLNALERSIAANDSASATGTANRSAPATRGARGSVNWGTEVAAMDKTLTALLGPGTATTGATATTGNKAATAVTLDDATRAKLTEFRTHLTAFAAAMAGQQPPAGETAPSATPPTASAAAATTDPAQAPATPPAAPAAGATPAKADEEASRRHLTEARNTLTQLTQLPAAAQLSGEARTQLTQLISNFNELITTQSEWRAVYGKVAANLTALLGPDSGATDPASPAGTASAVGTSGPGMNLDPAVRAKLVEMRKLLAEFERAAGGGAAATVSAAAPAAAPTTSPKAAAEPPTAPAATAPAAGTTATAQSASSEPLRHVAAIEALFKSQNESGGVTLDKTQVELLRTHIAELRKLLEQAKK